MVKYNFLLVVVFLLIACKAKDSNNTDPLVKKEVDTVFVYGGNNTDWQKSFKLTHNPDIDSVWFKPVSYYLNDEECSGLAYDFYFGALRPSDNGTTDELLKLATTNNNKLRPFYRWCLNLTIIIQDGALGEHTGVPARKYAEKYPKEFIEYMDKDKSGNRYQDWCGSIEYSGYYREENWDCNLARKNLIKTMLNNCISCDDILKDRIKKFAYDCFPDSSNN